MKTLIALFVLTLSSCSINTHSPNFYNEQYGKVTSEHPAYQADAIECTTEAQNNIGQINEIDPNNLVIEKNITNTIEAVQMATKSITFFDSITTCIKNKGWILLEE